MNEALILPASRALPRNTTNDSATLCAHSTEYFFSFNRLLQRQQAAEVARPARESRYQQLPPPCAGWEVAAAGRRRWRSWPEAPAGCCSASRLTKLRCQLEISAAAAAVRPLSPPSPLPLLRLPWSLSLSHWHGAQGPPKHLSGAA
jgi:hypothetical protein